MNTPVLAWLGFGGNFTDSAKRVEQAIARLAAMPEMELEQRSGLYRTTPWGDTDQDDFVNAVAVFRTTFAPLELLGVCHEMERQLGRQRHSDRRWGPRAIDIDLLLVNGQQLDSSELTLPHPRMHERAFVLVPLAELAPELAIPGHGTVQQCLRALDTTGIAPWSENTGAPGVSA